MLLNLPSTASVTRHNALARILWSCIVIPAFSFGVLSCRNNDGRSFAVVAYVHGDTANITRYPLGTLTHICYSFAHLKGNLCSLNNGRDTATILYLTSLKREYPSLKILLSLGGWGGCPTCSDVFSTDSGRSEFSRSVATLLNGLGMDGIDLDWEYPAVEGYPGHRFTPGDRHNFTLLVRDLRKVLGPAKEVTVAAGATADCLARSVAWSDVMPYIDRVHLMTYDLVNGYSTVTGHHTPLFPTPEQDLSTDYAIRFLDSAGVPPAKMAIGIAFYARVWEDVGSGNNGLYQSGKFIRSVAYRDFDQYFSKERGFEYHWDSTAQAPYVYSPSLKQFGTFDDPKSVSLKTSYARSHRLGGVMFWELKGDAYRNGLLDAIGRVLSQSHSFRTESK